LFSARKNTNFTTNGLNDSFNRLAKSLATELAPDAIRRRSLSLMVVYYEDEDVKAETSPRKVYMIINGEKVYIDPEIVKKYDLDRQKLSPFTGRKLYTEED